MTERKDGDTLKKVEWFSGGTAILGLLLEWPGVAVGALLFFAGAKGVEYYQRSRK
jgi:hypothetical protein